MDTPNMLRGEFYPTHFFARCLNFKQCPVCTMCENYDRYQAMCVFCETRKQPVRRCECKPETKATIRMIEKKTGHSIFDPFGGGSTKISECTKEKEYNTLMEGFEKM